MARAYDNSARTEAARETRARILAAARALILEQGYAEPERDWEIAHPDTGEVLSIAEAAWPHGLQAGLGEKVVLELDEEDVNEDGLAALGYRVFTSTDAVREFVSRLSSASEMP